MSRPGLHEEKICRLCLSNTGVILPIFDGEISVRFAVPLPCKIMACLSIEISCNNNTPNFICHRCLYEIDRFHEFKETCTKANATLKQWISITDPDVDITKTLDIKAEVLDSCEYLDAQDDPLSDYSRCEPESPSQRAEETAIPDDSNTPTIIPAEVVTQVAVPVATRDEGSCQIMKEQSIANHKTSESKDRPIRSQFNCRYCKRVFVYRTSLNKHEASHTRVSDKIQRCKFCSKPFNNLDKLNRHKRIHEIKESALVTKLEGSRNAVKQISAKSEGGNELYKCRYCSKTFKIRKSWWYHERMDCDLNPASSRVKLNGKVWHNCRYCSKSFAHRGSWWRHQKFSCSLNPLRSVPNSEGKVIQSFTCKLCDTKFIHQGSWQRHQKFHSGTQPFRCRYCPKAFNERPHVVRHERTHLGIKPFSCNVCKKTFCDISNLRNHERTHAAQKPFLCSQCGKSFNFKSRLLKHELVHAGIREQVCKVCSKTFIDAADLKKHMKCHNKHRPFLCSECGKSFTHNGVLKAHARIHIAVKPYVCEVCRKSFRDSSNYRAHQKLHSKGPRPYPCPHCSRSYHQKSQLRLHIRTHTGEKPHRCRFCPKTFRLGTRLNVHEKTHDDYYTTTRNPDN